jgi:hypothetical protein
MQKLLRIRASITSLKSKSKRNFASKKKAKPEDGELIEKKHINEAHRKFKKLMRWEVMPIFALASSAIIYFKFQTQFLNLLPQQYFAAISAPQERYISRKISSLLKYQYCT